MQSTSNNSESPSDLVSRTNDSLSESSNLETRHINASNTQKLETISVSVSSIPIGKLIMGSLLLLCVFATFFVLTKGSEFCLLSTCYHTPPSSTGGDFWAYAGGTATLVILTTIFGLPLLPAVGVSAGIWFLMNMSL